MKNKFYYIGLNLVVPGTGQMAAKRYIRGTLQIMLAVGAVLWLIWEVMMPFIDFYNGDMLADKLPQIKLASILMPIALFFAVLTWSIVDMLFKSKKINCEEKDDKNQ